MANLKDIKVRIASVKKTKQITSAMKLVAAAKLKRATDRALAARPYRENLSSVIGRVAAAAGDDIEEPLLQTHDQVDRVLVILLTSDRGLCGGFNNALLRQLKHWVAERRSEKTEVTLRVFGRKGSGFVDKQDYKVIETTTDWGKIDKMEMVRPLASLAVAGFVDYDFDEVYLAFNKFENTLSQVPTFERILPLTLDQGEEEQESGDYRYEPSAPQLLNALLPLYLGTIILSSFLESEAGEFAARMTAMENATRNASDLIDQLTLDFNRARQAAITTEIIEITSGAAALE